MVSILKNKEGYIYAYAETRIVDKHGTIKKDGEYVYVKDLWIHPEYRKTRTLSHLIFEIDKHSPDSCQYVYWRNMKQGKRISRSFIREKAKTKGVEIC